LDKSLNQVHFAPPLLVFFRFIFVSPAAPAADGCRTTGHCHPIRLANHVAWQKKQKSLAIYRQAKKLKPADGSNHYRPLPPWLNDSSSGRWTTEQLLNPQILLQGLPAYLTKIRSH
jgi:hypothetical protein